MSAPGNRRSWFSFEVRTLSVASLEEATMHILGIHSDVERGPARTVKVYETSEELMKDFGGGK